MLSDFQEKMTRITSFCFAQLYVFAMGSIAAILPFAKVIRSKRRNFFLLGICAMACVYGLTFSFLSALGGRDFMRNLMNEGIRTYPQGFERSNTQPDEPTVNAVQFTENFLDNVPCEDTWRSNSCYRNVVAYANERQRGGTVVLAVVTAGRYEIALNWCVSMKKLGITNYMLVALDNDSFQFFSGLRAPVVRLPGAQKELVKNDIWVKRTLLTYMIMRAGLNVLVSDFDAVSVKSPFRSKLFNIEEASLDIITTPSNFPNPSKKELPDECPQPRLWWSGKEWRHQPCMGWTLFRSSPRMISFFEEKLLYDVLKFRDDQIGFNCAIRRAGAMWRESKKEVKWKGMVTYSQAPKLTILMLPADRYVRNCTEHTRNTANHGIVEMYHCKGNNKEANARSNGFWFLRDDWFSIRDESWVFDSYLMKITSP